MDISKMRSNFKITQQTLAKEVGVTRSTVTKWETGKSMPRIDTLRKLANVFGCTVDDLLQPENEAK